MGLGEIRERVSGIVTRVDNWTNPITGGLTTVTTVVAAVCLGAAMTHKNERGVLLLCFAVFAFPGAANYRDPRIGRLSAAILTLPLFAATGAVIEDI